MQEDHHPLNLDADVTDHHQSINTGILKGHHPGNLRLGAVVVNIVINAVGNLLRRKSQGSINDVTGLRKLI